MPSGKRKPVSIGALIEKAQPRASMTYTDPAITVVHLRLMASAR